MTAGTRQAARGTQSTDRQTLPGPGWRFPPSSCWGAPTQNPASPRRSQVISQQEQDKKQALFFCCSKESRALLRAFPRSTAGQRHCQLLKRRQGEQHEWCKVLKGSAVQDPQIPACRPSQRLRSSLTPWCEQPQTSPPARPAHTRLVFHSEVQQTNCRQDRETQL